MTIELHDAIGLFGTACVIFAYFLLQIRIYRARHPRYLLLNIVGSVCILYSLFFDWNLAGVIINIFWIRISVMGLIAAIRHARNLDSSASSE